MEHHRGNILKTNGSLSSKLPNSEKMMWFGGVNETREKYILSPFSRLSAFIYFVEFESCLPRVSGQSL